MNQQNSEQDKSNGSNKNWSDLGQRLVSAVILAALVLTITYIGALPFALLIALGGGILCWEWAKIVRKTDFDEMLVVHVISVLVSCGLVYMEQVSVALLVLLIGPAIKFLQSRDKEAIELGASLLGVPYIGLPVIAMIWLRSDMEYGFQLIIYLFVIVWSVDIFAYLSGRSFGGPKLAPSISPKKTWSGFIGGVSAGMIAGVLFSQYLGNDKLLPIAIMALAIGIFSQMGDLFESVFKRHYNVKDASNLIPGHGGLFDRVDGLLFAALLAALIALLVDPAHPGRVLLFWGAA
ncbi:MAG: phosphatidate cytidylyltransferase [Hyphomicrobiaceae bacterium]|nr:phosphatidate cytidylyltransferase [Hyphomicrobiaceae bacterium]